MKSLDYVGVVLAAGVGSRLRPMTSSSPKCMVKTAGKPILQYQIDAYVKAGVRDLVIVVGYEGAVVREYCKHIKDVRISIVENIEYETTNNMYSFYLVRELISGRPFILNNADVAIDSSIVSVLLEANAESAVAVDTSVYSDESMKVVVNADGYVVDISKSIKEEISSGCSIDFYKFSQQDGEAFIGEVVSIIEGEGNVKDWTEVALQRSFQSQRLKFQMVDISGLNWVEIDNYEDLAISDRKFSGFDKSILSVEAIFLDLDGTVYVGKEAVPGVAEVISSLRTSGKKIFFLSNNSSKSKNDYVQRLQALGIECSVQDFILSTDSLLEYLGEQGVKSVHVLGTRSLEQACLEAGFIVDSPTPEYVVIGYDTELSYKKLVDACRHINRGVDILATHIDMFCPSEVGPIPDVGALLEMIRLTTGKEPRRVFGKPDRSVVDGVLRSLAISPENALFVGDRLHTDIKLAKNVGAKSLLVLTGETKRDVCQDHAIQPDFILPSLAQV